MNIVLSMPYDERGQRIHVNFGVDSYHFLTVSFYGEDLVLTQGFEICVAKAHMTEKPRPRDVAGLAIGE